MLDLILMLGLTMRSAVLGGELGVRCPRPAPADDPRASVRANLLRQQDTLYSAIRDVVFAFQTGKVDQQEYVEVRQRLEREAIQVLRLLDTRDRGRAWDAALEQHMAQRRQRPRGGAPVSSPAHVWAVEQGHTVQSTASRPVDNRP
jgi:hypothetical protein